MASITNKLKTISGLLSMAALMSLGISAHAQNGEAVFKQNCSACHSVGKGRLVGPDLKGVTSKRTEEWLTKFIKSSQGLIKSGDADAKAIFEEFGKITMPDQNLADADIKAIIEFIKSKSPAEEIAQTPAQETISQATQQEPEKNSSDANKEDINAGLNLFTGKQRFTNKGAACTSCHHADFDGVIGGSLAKELTTVHGNMGDAGIKGILSSPPFPAMATTYKEKAITDEEIYQITAFLNHVNKERIYQHHTKYEGYLIYGGGLGVLCLLCGIYFIWLNRKKQGVKHKIFERQTRTV